MTYIDEDELQKRVMDFSVRIVMVRREERVKEAEEFAAKLWKDFKEHLEDIEMELTYGEDI